MCKPKSEGGLRCASHAGKELKAAQQAFKSAPTPETYEDLDKAEYAYNLTVTGIKALRESEDPQDHAKAEMFEELRASHLAEAKEKAKEKARLERKRKAAEARAQKKALAEEEERFRNSTEGKARTAWQEAGVNQKAAWEAFQNDPENAELREAFERARLEEDNAFEAYADARERAAFVKDRASDPDGLKGFVTDPTPLKDRLKVVSDPETSSEALAPYADDADSVVREKVASHKNTAPEVLDKFADDPDHRVTYAMVQNPNVRFATLRKAMQFALPYIRVAIVNTKTWIAETRAVKDMSGRLNATVEKQRAWASSRQTPVKFLLVLSTSGDMETVRSVAFHPSLPTKVAQRLVRHPDEKVRKIAATHVVWEKKATV